MSPMAQASMAMTRMSAPCCIPALPHGHPRWQSPSTPAHRAVTYWLRLSPAMKPQSVLGSRFNPAISSAASRAPAHVMASARGSRRPVVVSREECRAPHRRAMGLAGGYASGVAQFYYSGASAKRIQAAHSAESGVAAALLVAQGYSGPVDIIEGAGGFARAYTDG